MDHSKQNNRLALFLPIAQFSTGNLKFMYYLIKQDHGQQDGDPTYEASCSSFETHLITEGNLKDLSVILNFLKNQLNS